MKRFTSMLLIITVILGLTGCRSDKDSSTTITTESETAQATSELTTTSEPEPPTTYVDGIGEIYLEEPHYLSKDDFGVLQSRNGKYGGVGLGIDNPTILEQARKYFKDNTLTIEQVGYFQCDELCDGDPNRIGNSMADKKRVMESLQNVGNQGKIANDIARYILSLNGDKYMINQISYDFFSKHFPDYVNECNEGKTADFLNNGLFDNPYYERFIFNLNDKGYAALNNFISDHASDSEAREMIKLYLFVHLMDYNYNWFSLASSSSTVCNFMPIAKTTDGKYVVVPPTSQLQRQVNLIPKCENLDITKVETYEDLKNSGVEVEIIEKAFKYAGIDIPLLSKS